MIAPREVPGAGPTRHGRLPHRRRPVLAAAAALAVAANVAVIPYYAVRSDDPATFHVALGVRPAWSPPTAEDAFIALRRRFPGRVTGDTASLTGAELERLYQVRRNGVRSVAHAALGALLVAAAALLDRRRRRRAGAP